jgi:hypothetical protein
MSDSANFAEIATARRGGRRQNPQGRETDRSPRRADDQARSGDQPRQACDRHGEGRRREPAAHCQCGKRIGSTDRCSFIGEEVGARSQVTMPRQPLSRCLVIWSG